MVDSERLAGSYKENTITFVDIDTFTIVDDAERKRVVALTDSTVALIRDATENYVDLSSMTTNVYGPTLIGCLLGYPHVYTRKVDADGAVGVQRSLLDDEATVDVFQVVLDSTAFSGIKSEGVKWLEKHEHTVIRREVIFSEADTGHSYVAWNWSLPSVLTDDSQVDSLMEHTLQRFATMRSRTVPITKLELLLHRRITGSFSL